MRVLGNTLAATANAPLGMACTCVFGSNTSDYMRRKIITVRLSAEDEKMFARLLKNKAGHATQFGLLPPSQSQLVRALIREAYFDLTGDGHRQQRLG